MSKNFIIYVHIAPNGKLYIGQTCQTLSDRSRNGKGYKDSPLFYKAIKKYEWNQFQHIVLIENLDMERANVFEELLIEKYKTNNRKFGYNIAKGGLNTLHSQETILKIRKANQGKIISEESKRKMSIAHKGKYVENIKIEKDLCVNIQWMEILLENMGV